MTSNKNIKSFVKLKKIKAQMVECRKTQKLILSSLELSELPASFMNLLKGAGVNVIMEFDFHSNDLKDLISESSEFHNLRILRINDNRFQELPLVVFAFSKLQVLDVSANDLHEVDESIGSLGALRELNFSRNKLTVLPNVWRKMLTLLSLNVANNKLASLPESLGSLRNLQLLDVSENFLTLLPSSLEGLQELVTLDVHANEITALPPSFSLLKNLRSFNCGENPLAEPANTVYLQGFEEFMEYLRDVYEQQQLEDLIRKRPPASVVGSFKKLPTTSSEGLWPRVRSGHSITQAGSATYIFGGNVGSSGKVDDLFSIDVRTLLWVKRTTHGIVPAPRDNHAAAFDGRKRLYIFGGRNGEQKLLNDTYYLDLKNMTWYQPTVEGATPSVREGASIAVVGSQVVLFGGRGSKQRHNDLHTLCTQTWTWTPCRTKGSIPSPRQNAALAISGTNIYIHGGKGNLTLEDLHVVDVVGLVWYRVLYKGENFSARHSHIATIQQKKFYVFGGVDKTDQTLTSLFELPLGTEGKTESFQSSQVETFSAEDKPGSNTSRMGAWKELNSELPFNNTYTYCFHEDKLLVFQNDDDTVHGESMLVWNVYMEAKIACFQPKALHEEKENFLDSKTSRVKKMQTKMPDFPKSFRWLSYKEKQLLKHVHHYEKRFQQIYPERRPLMFVAQNECGIEKFLCTTIRPSHITYLELHNWEVCCRFLACFLQYELLEDPTQFPVYLPSSRTILKWQKGDCFDFSIALVSLLAGAGYEAYCVAGYAPLALTSNNQESCSCPVANEEKQIKSTHLPMEGREDLKYSVKSVPILNSHYFEKVKRERDSTVSSFVENFKLNFDQELELGQNEEDDNLVRFCLEKSSADIPAEEVSETHLNVNGGMSSPGSKVKFDETCSIENVKGTPTAIHATNLSNYLDKYRIHCWVIIFGGKQGISENIFVEPSTGNHYPLLGSPYQGVEFIWNQSNLWINMQANPRRSGLDKMSWDLRDTTKWERILSGSKTDNHFGDSNNIAVNTVLRSPRLQESYTSDSSHLAPTGIIKPDGVHFEHLKERIFTETSDKALKQSSRGNTGNKSKSATEKKLSDDLSDNTEGVTDSYHFLLPPSWVPKLEIPVDAFVTRSLKGMKRTLYNKCTHEIYAFYGDYARWDGLIERVQFYADDERSILLECHDYFQRRKDQLKERIFFPQQNKVHDIFHPGTTFGVKEIEIVDGINKKFLFHSECRSDGLVSREEIVGKKVVEAFANPENPLVYRCVCYGSLEPQSPNLKDIVMGLNLEGAGRLNLSQPSTARGDGSSRPGSRGRLSVESAKVKSYSRTASRFRGSVPVKSKGTTEKNDNPTEKTFNLSVVPRKKTMADNLLPIAKITLKYSNRSGVRQQKNAARHVFKLTTDQIRVDYHNVDRHLTITSRLYSKDGSMRLLQVDPFEPEMETFERIDEFHQLLMTERETIKAIRDAEDETYDILQQRFRDEQNVVLLTPYSDVAWFKHDDLINQDSEAEAKVETDYLSPYLPGCTRPKHKLSRQQMMETRDSCLRALKERLVNQATTIQARYDEETATLAKRRANFERDREQMTVEEVEKQEQMCEDAVFRIRILERRAKEHEEQAIKKYIEMDQKLRHDPCLATLYDGISNK